MKKEGISEEDIELEKKNWHLLEGKRYYIANSYDFVIESVGVFENMEIVVKACNIMIDKCNKFLSDLEHGEVSIVKSESTLNNGFDVTLKNEDYTLGKVIEYYLYQQHFIADKTVTFCGFRKPHPHSKDSLIRIAFRDPIEAVGVSSRFQGAADNAIHAYSEILKQLGGELAKTGLGSQSELQQQQQLESQPTKTTESKSDRKEKGTSGSLSKKKSQSESKKASSKKDEENLGEDFQEDAGIDVNEE